MSENKKGIAIFCCIHVAQKKLRNLRMRRENKKERKNYPHAKVEKVNKKQSYTQSYALYPQKCG